MSDPGFYAAADLNIIHHLVLTIATGAMAHAACCSILAQGLNVSRAVRGIIVLDAQTVHPAVVGAGHLVRVKMSELVGN